MNYFMGIDLARKSDWTVATVIDSDGHVVACDRFHQISWSLQVERCALLYRTFHCSKAVVDSTGLGDVVIEQLEEQGLTVEPYIFSLPSRKALIEELVLAFDNAEITIPTTEKFAVFRSELENFEYSLDGSTIRYAAAPGSHDDCVMSLALAVHGWRASRGMVLGMVLLVQRYAKEIGEGIRDRWGELIHRAPPKPLPVAVRKEAARPAVTRVEGYLAQKGDPPKCPLCGGPRIWMSGGGVPGVLKAHCNQDSSDDGVLPPKPIAADGTCWVEGCGLRLVPAGSGTMRCQNHGQVPSSPPQAVGMTRAAYAARQDVFGRGRFGRFG